MEDKKSPIQLRIPLKVYKNIEEIMVEPLLEQRIRHYISVLLSERTSRKALAGMRFLRDAVDAMINEKELNTAFMLAHYADVHNKVSSIPASKRNVMSYICTRSINDVLNDSIVYAHQGDKFNVAGSKSKLSIVSINETDSTLVVELKKVKETWPIQQFVNSVIDKTLVKCS